MKHHSSLEIKHSSNETLYRGTMFDIRVGEVLDASTKELQALS